MILESTERTFVRRIKHVFVQSILTLFKKRRFARRDSRSEHYPFPFSTILLRIDNRSASPEFLQTKAVARIEAAGTKGGKQAVEFDSLLTPTSLLLKRPHAP